MKALYLFWTTRLLLNLQSLRGFWSILWIQLVPWRKFLHSCVVPGSPASSNLQSTRTFLNGHEHTNEARCLALSRYCWPTLICVLGTTRPAEPGAKSSTSSNVNNPPSVLPYPCTRPLGFAFANTSLVLVALKGLPPVNNVRSLKFTPHCAICSEGCFESSSRWLGSMKTLFICRQKFSTVVVEERQVNSHRTLRSFAHRLKIPTLYFSAFLRYSAIDRTFCKTIFFLV